MNQPAVIYNDPPTEDIYRSEREDLADRINGYVLEILDGEEVRIDGDEISMNTIYSNDPVAFAELTVAMTSGALKSDEFISQLHDMIRDHAKQWIADALENEGTPRILLDQAV